MRIRALLVAVAVPLTLGACAGPSLPEPPAGLVDRYPGFYAVLSEHGCPRCHTTGPQTIPNAFKLPPPGEDDLQAVRMLWRKLDAPTIEESRLVRKPSGELGHRGGKILLATQRAGFVAAIENWRRP